MVVLIDKIYIFNNTYIYINENVLKELKHLNDIQLSTNKGNQGEYIWYGKYATYYYNIDKDYDVIIKDITELKGVE